MNFAQALDIAVPLAAVMVPGFVLGLGIIENSAQLAGRAGMARIPALHSAVTDTVVGLVSYLYRAMGCHGIP